LPFERNLQRYTEEMRGEGNAGKDTLGGDIVDGYHIAETHNLNNIVVNGGGGGAGAGLGGGKGGGAGGKVSGAAAAAVAAAASAAAGAAGKLTSAQAARAAVAAIAAEKAAADSAAAAARAAAAVHRDPGVLFQQFKYFRDNCDLLNIRRIANMDSMFFAVVLHDMERSLAANERDARLMPLYEMTVEWMSRLLNGGALYVESS
jgi:hypothetical protein